MKQLALALALSGALALGVPAPSAAASMETFEAKSTASSAAAIAREDMYQAFGDKQLKPGQYLWRDVSADGESRLVVSLSDQLAYLYRGDTLVAVSTISSGRAEHPTPTGIFNVHAKTPMHRSVKYENAPMPFAQFFDEYGTALHAGQLPGHPASHGCVRLPAKFAAKLYTVTDVGTSVLIGA
jgi:lipoprotein-anchoring transpeptidase ErfK/SrfK